MAADLAMVVSKGPDYEALNKAVELLIDNSPDIFTSKYKPKVKARVLLSNIIGLFEPFGVAKSISKQTTFTDVSCCRSPSRESVYSFFVSSFS